MKKLVLMGVAALTASLGLSACGVKASLDGAVSSLGSSPNLQVHLTADVTSTGAPASVVKDEALVKDFSMDLRYSDSSGVALSSAGSDVNSEILFNVNGSPLLDVRALGSNIYLEVDLTALEKVPGLNVPSSELAGAQLLLGGRWFEVPGSLLSSLEQTTTAQKAQDKKVAGIEREVIDKIATLIETSPYTTLSGGGYSESGSLSSIVTAIWPTISSLLPSASAPSSVPGTFALTLLMSGSSITGGSVGLTAPAGTGESATVTLNATVAHGTDDVVAPTGATVITPALLKQFTGLGQGTSSTLWGVQGGTNSGSTSAT